MSGPDVCVVVISYNDAERLPRAIRSIQRQTLRSLEIVVVDDASTDETESVVRGLADGDARIRYERLPENSGGCSAPRNHGMSVARAPWVMFCDSDDEYERHACKNLLRAAEDLDADVVCGTAERIDVATGRRRRWRPEVHDAVRVEDGLEAFPDLIYDTISVNKIYRRALLQDAGIAFPEGLLFEDQLFTLEAFAAARRLAAIPETVYRWYVDRLSDEPSITQRRHEVRNVDSRIEINRRIDAFLAARGLVGIQRLKDVKFLRHDLYLYLSSMLEADDDTAIALMDRLRPYVASIDLGPTADLRPGLRVAVYHLLIGDLACLRSAMRTVKWASVVGAPIIADDGRELWACDHLRAGPHVGGMAPDTWLDITALHALAVPFTQRRYLHAIETMSVDGDIITATGTTVDFDGTLAGVEGIELRFLINADRTVLSVPAEWVERTGGVWKWRARGRAAPSLPRRLEPKDRGTVGLALARAGQVSVVSVRASRRQVPSASVPYPGESRATGPDTLELEPYENGAVGWRAVRLTPGHRRAAAWQARWFRVPGARRLADLVADGLPVVVQRVGALLPPRRLAVFESASGRAAEGEPRAISDRLHALHPEIAQAWVRRSAFVEVPSHAEPVERYSLRHRWLTARARYWVDDGTAPPSIRRPARTRAVVTGTGVPITRRGLDDPSVLVDRGAVRDVRRRSARVHLALAASAQVVGSLRSAAAYGGPVATPGLSRADAPIVLHSVGEAALRDLRSDLDLPQDRTLVLYSPARRSEHDDAVSLVDLQQWCAVMGETTYLLLRGEVPGRYEVPTRLRYAVRDMGQHDLGWLLAACDMLVSDYASVIGEGALVDLPVVLYQPDREVYVNRTHGLYMELADVGPLVEDQDALMAEVRRWQADPTAWDDARGPARRNWAKRWCGPADGASAARAVEAILAGPGGS